MNYATGAQSLIGQDVTINGIRHTVSRLSSKEGKLKNGDTAQYLTVVSALGNEQELHPRTVKELFSKGESAGIKMLVDAEAAVVENATPASIKAEHESNIESALAKLEAMVTKAPVAAAPTPEVKKVTKKAQAIAIYNEVMADASVDSKLKRQAVLKRWMSEAGMTLNGCNTYFQAIKSAAWK